ncbi:MAG: flagellar basal body L-ring protein FlgH, partial [Proteobacteria bacterium]|nr:flagellar basal body L-ring protein FlgH [Pseudomonadota bacterium]
MMRASFSLAGLAAALLATTAADAKLFGKKAPAEDFTAARLAPLPQPAADPQPNGAIFQVASGYAALHEGWRARRVGDLLTIVLVERTAASKSASSKLDSGGGFGLTPPSTGPLSLFKSTDASASGTRNFTGAGTTDQANSLTGAISVTVAKIYPNGTLLVQGQKHVTLN